MAAETDAHHVVNLPLVPIRRAPDPGHSRRLALLLAYVGLEAKRAQVAITIKVIHEREARVVAVVIHARDVHEVVKPQLPLGHGANLRHPLGVGDLQRDFAPELDRLGNQAGEFGFELLR